MKVKHFFYLPAIFLLLFLLSSKPVRASDAFMNVTYMYPIVDQNYADGDIVTFDESASKVNLSTKDQDDGMFGVIVLNPQVLFKEDQEGVPIVRDGEAFVNVTSRNGAIAVGDYITSSPLAGKGQKASNLGGYILGRALEVLDETNGTKETSEGKEILTGQIRVTVDIGPGYSASLKARASILDQFSVLMLRNFQRPEGASLFLRYVTAGLVFFGVIFICFNSFGRNITKGIESLGRNPLARTQIQTMVVANMIMIVIIGVIGFLIGLVIIRM